MVRDDGTFRYRVDANTRCLAQLRRELRAWLEAAGVAADRHDVVLAASELATAGMRAAPAPDAAVTVEVWRDRGTVVIESRSDVGDGTFVGEPMKAFDGTDGGRGFSIVASLSDVFTVKGAGSGVVVRAQMARDRFDPVAAG